MCGIAGIIRFDGTSPDQADLDALTDALAHRGPDGRGTFIHGAVGLGHRRLAIIDVSDAGAQPMVSPDEQIVVSFNGEIYNFQEKRRELEQMGYQFRSHCDTEVLLHLYRAYGEDCIEHLRGMFAFALYDRARQTVFIARDRVGKKPLFYLQSENQYIFASEIKALRALECCRTGMDRDAVRRMLTMMYVPAPQTGFAGIQSIPAAHTVTIHLGAKQVMQKRYWTLRYEPDDAPSVAEWQQQIASVFEESVALRMVADVPVGAFLSGGVDSAAVVSRMSRLSASPVQTFSIGSTSERHNELPDADVVAKRYAAIHHPHVLTPDIVRLLPELVHTYEQPFADPSVIPTYLVARFASRHVKVVLNGDGGDENFAGYIRYPIARFAAQWARMPTPVHAVTLAGARLLHHMRDDTLSYRILRFQQSIRLPPAQRYLQYLSFFSDAEAGSILRDSTRQSTAEWYEHRVAEARSRAGDEVRRCLSADLETYLADDLLPKVDRGTMAHGLEARSPLLDHTLLELSARIPTRHLLHGRTGKWIFKDLLTEDVPHQILYRSKRGFRLPLNDWFRGELHEWMRESIMDAPPEFWTMFDPRAVEQFLRSYTESNVDLSDHVWALLWLSEWMRQYT